MKTYLIRDRVRHASLSSTRDPCPLEMADRIRLALYPELTGS